MTRRGERLGEGGGDGALREYDCRMIVAALRSLVAEVVDSALKEVLAADERGQCASWLLDREGLARAISTSTSTVDRLRREGLPVILVGDSPRFDTHEVVEWLKNRTRAEPANGGGDS